MLLDAATVKLFTHWYPKGAVTRNNVEVNWNGTTEIKTRAFVRVYGMVDDNVTCMFCMVSSTPLLRVHAPRSLKEIRTRHRHSRVEERGGAVELVVVGTVRPDEPFLLLFLRVHTRLYYVNLETEAGRRPEQCGVDGASNAQMLPD